MGPCLTAATPEAAPGALFLKESRYAKARTSTSAVTAAICAGGFMSTSLHHRTRHPLSASEPAQECHTDATSCQLLIDVLTNRLDISHYSAAVLPPPKP